MALDTLHGSAADNPGMTKLKAYKQELDEFIEMAESIDTQPSEGITEFQQAHDLRTDWPDTTSLAWDGWILFDDHRGKYRILRCINFER